MEGNRRPAQCRDARRVFKLFRLMRICKHLNRKRSNNKKAVGTKHGEGAGASSAGEFGSALLAIFDPKSNTVFRGHRDADLRGRHVYVFAFQVPKEAGIHVAARNTGEETVAPYHGLIFFDAKANEVLRILTLFDLPHGFPRSEEHTSELQSLRHLVCRL